jgi:hypothetical protein
MANEIRRMRDRAEDCEASAEWACASATPTSLESVDRLRGEADELERKSEEQSPWLRRTVKEARWAGGNRG